MRENFLPPHPQGFRHILHTGIVQTTSFDTHHDLQFITYKFYTPEGCFSDIWYLKTELEIPDAPGR